MGDKGLSNTFSFNCRFWIEVLKTEFLDVQKPILLVKEQKFADFSFKFSIFIKNFTIVELENSQFKIDCFN